MVLPMAARNLDGRSGRSPYYSESLQVLQSYMAVRDTQLVIMTHFSELTKPLQISAEHAAYTRSLVERTFRMSAHLVTFLTEFTKLASRHAASGQKEMYDLSLRLSELQHTVHQ